MKAEWLGWLHKNPQNPCLGLSPADASGFLVGKLSESNAGSLSSLGHGPCDQPDLAWFAGVCWKLLDVFFLDRLSCAWYL